MRLRAILASLGLATVAAATIVALPLDTASAQRRDRPGPSAPRPGTWELLGSQKVGFKVDRDVIRVGRQDGRFRAIKLRVLDNDIELLDLRVVYGNGEPDNIPVRQFLRRNSETRTIDLRGNTRFIREIQMTYKSRPNFRGRATVQVFGLH
ncbi:MAG: hypothetical protein R3D44_18600 [Hyphomicrobiaceae bacterium]